MTDEKFVEGVKLLNIDCDDDKGQEIGLKAVKETLNYKFRYVMLTDSWGQRPHNEGGFYLDWSAEGIGFGRLSFVKYLDVDNPDLTKTICETENMSEDFVRAAVKFWIENQVQLVDK